MRTRVPWYWYIYTLAIFCCLAAMLGWTAVLVRSWWGGPEGYVGMVTNLYHERLAETILFSSISIIAIIWVIKVYLKRGNK